jgi:hypothetical protein
MSNIKEGAPRSLLTFSHFWYRRRALFAAAFPSSRAAAHSAKPLFPLVVLGRRDGARTRGAPRKSQHKRGRQPAGCFVRNFTKLNAGEHAAAHKTTEG